MAAPKFTPGPWRISRYGETIEIPEIAEMLLCKGTAEANANAALIAAAPELYAALAEAEWQVSRHSNGLNQACEQWLAKARSALAKARGE